MIGGRVLDASAIADIATGRTLYATAFLAAATDLGIPLAIPAAALQRAWAHADDDGYPFLELLVGLPVCLVEALDADQAARSGLLHGSAAASGTFDAAVTHTVLVALQRGWPVLTAQPEPLLALEPTLAVELLPAE